MYLAILNYLPISAYCGLLKFDMEMFVNIARLDISHLFTQSTRRGHLCTLDTFLVENFIGEKARKCGGIRLNFHTRREFHQSCADPYSRSIF